MELNGRHQGGLKNWGECQAGRGIRGEELPGRYLSERGTKNKEGTDEGESKNRDKS